VIDAQLVQGSAADATNATSATNVWKISRLVEKPSIEEAPSNLAVFGRYLLTPKVMEILKHTAPGAGGEIQLTDALEELLKTEEMYAVEVAPNEGFDCGTVANWLDTNIRLALRNPDLASTVRAAAES
jgi:UTP--glucose-1-phosphate uridylyltransferase